MSRLNALVSIAGRPAPASLANMQQGHKSNDPSGKYNIARDLKLIGLRLGAFDVSVFGIFSANLIPVPFPAVLSTAAIVSE